MTERKQEGRKQEMTEREDENGDNKLQGNRTTGTLRSCEL